MGEVTVQAFFERSGFWVVYQRMAEIRRSKRQNNKVFLTRLTVSVDSRIDDSFGLVRFTQFTGLGISATQTAANSHNQTFHEIDINLDQMNGIARI